MSKVTELTKEFQRVMYSTTYSFEIDTEDYVFGFKNTIKKRTKSLAKASKLKVKLTNDCGRFLSETVRVVAVRFYKNGELTKKLKAEEICCYMNTDLDKDLFCKLWIENPTALKEIERKTVLVRELYEERKCLSNLLIDQAEKCNASDLREMAIAMTVSYTHLTLPTICSV